MLGPPTRHLRPTVAYNQDHCPNDARSSRQQDLVETLSIRSSDRRHVAMSREGPTTSARIHAAVRTGTAGRKPLVAGLSSSWPSFAVLMYSADFADKRWSWALAASNTGAPSTQIPPLGDRDQHPARMARASPPHRHKSHAPR